VASVAGLDWVHGSEEPLAGESSVELHSWEEAALDDPRRFTADLEAMGLQPDEVGAAVGIREEAHAEVEAAVQSFWDNHPIRYYKTPPEVEAQVTQIYQSARRTARQRIGDWLQRRRFEVQEREEVELRLPLFVLSAPPTARSAATFKTEQTATRTVGWSISIAGSGVGSDATIKSSVSSSFKAEAGQTKVVFLPVRVAVEKLRVTDRGDSVHRVDVTPLEGAHPAPGLLLLDPGALPAIGSLEQTYPLAGDPSGTPATYEYSYTQSRALDLKLGVKAFGSELKVESSATLEAAVSLTFELASGVDYELHRLAEGDGLLWK
jgi:hypothetical protein